MKPGIYDGITNAEYHGGPGVSKSMLDVIAAKSPMHLQYLRSAANDNEPTAAQALGTAFHSLLLEPDDFAASYVVAPKFDKRTKDGKAGWEAFQAEHEGKQFIDADMDAILSAMREAVHAHPVARALITAPGHAERSVYWTDPITGELCRCRPDYWREDGIIVDVKTTDDASPEGFAKSVANWRYHVQDPFYTDGIHQATGIAPRGFVFLVVEKKAPHAVAVYSLDRESRDLGRMEYRRDLQRYADCVRSGKWPGYGEVIQEIGVPQWKLLQGVREFGEAA